MDKRILDIISQKYTHIHGGFASNPDEFFTVCDKSIEFVDWLNTKNGLPDMILNYDFFSDDEKALIIAECLKHINTFYGKYKTQKTNLISRLGTPGSESIVDHMGKRVNVDEYLNKKLESHINSILKKYFIARITKLKNITSVEKINYLKTAVQTGTALTFNVGIPMNVDLKCIGIRTYDICYENYDEPEFGASYLIMQTIIDMDDISAEEKGELVSSVLLAKDLEDDCIEIVVDNYLNQMRRDVLKDFSDEERSAFGQSFLACLPSVCEKYYDKFARKLGVDLDIPITEVKRTNEEEVSVPLENNSQARELSILKENDDQTSNDKERIPIYKMAIGFFQRILKNKDNQR